jgi:WD40 repeat protein
VEIDPKKGSPQSSVLTATAQDGSFAAKVNGGGYLLILYQQGNKVYQAEVQVKGTTDIPIILTPSGAPGPSNCAPTVLHFRPTDSSGAPINNWSPIDLALDTDGSFLVLDSQRRVYRLSQGDKGFSSEQLFTLPAGVEPDAIASNDQHIYVTSNSNAGGCRLYSYSKATRSQSLRYHSLSACSGVAVDGQKVFVAFGVMGAVWVWDESNFQTPAHRFFPTLDGSAAMAVDSHTHELFIGTQIGLLYVVAPGGNPRQVADAQTPVASIGLGTDALLVVARDTTKCYDRHTNAHVHGYSPRPIAQCINGHLKGQYTGLRVDATQNAWLTDQVHDDFSGPFPVR